MLVPGFEVPPELNKEVERLLACGLQLGDNGELRQGHRPVVPQKMRKELLRQAHDSPSGGHLDAKKVLHQLLTRAWWPDIRQDVHNYVKSYPTWRKRKQPHRLPRAPLVKVAHHGYPADHGKLCSWTSSAHYRRRHEDLSTSYT